MLTISVDPVAFSIGSFTIRWYGIMVALAVITLLIITLRETKRLGFSQDFIYSLFLWGIIGGFVGARLVYLIDHLVAHPEEPVQIIGFAGLGLYGAVIGALAAVWIYMRVKKTPFSSLASVGDAIAVGAPLAQAIGRIGCTINGCCYGIPASLPWAVVYTHPDSYAPLGVSMHPTQIYFLLWNLIVFAVIWQFRGKLKPQGSSFFLYLCLYAVGDFGLRFFRVNDPFLILGNFSLQQGQVISLAILVVAVPWLIIRMRRLRSGVASPPPD
jgi:prolipoprotein diacylglyceryl transferase